MVFYQNKTVFSSQDLTWSDSPPPPLTPLAPSDAISEPIDLNGNIRLESAQINADGKELQLAFNRNIVVSNSQGFRLLGGPSRIKSLKSGSGTKMLTFSLTIPAHPESRYYRVLHWTELSDARSDSLKLASFEPVNVENRVSSYTGSGSVFYVSASGNDNNSGSKSEPLRQPSAAISKAKLGDLILLKRGDRFDNFKVENKRMEEDKPLVISSYGTGDLPKIQTTGHGVDINNSDHVIVDSLEILITSGTGNRGVSLRGNSESPVVSNCVIDSPNSMNFYGIELQRREDKSTKRLVAPLVLNNVVRNFRWNIRSSGFPFDGHHHVYGGLIENNFSDGNYDHPNARDGISTQRGSFHGIIIRKNKVRGYVDDGMDFFSAHDVIIEYNEIYSPKGFREKAKGSGSGNGIKLGGTTQGGDDISGRRAKNLIARYNRIYDISHPDSTGSNGFVTGDTTGAIFGNIIYNVRGHGIKVQTDPGEIYIYNNTVVNAKKKGFETWSRGGNPDRVFVFNNIFHGGKTSSCTTNNSGQVRGSSNIFLPQMIRGDYVGDNDRVEARTSSLFEDDSFVPKQSSHAINNGINQRNYPKDFFGAHVGEQRNIGALEGIGSQ